MTFQDNYIDERFKQLDKLVTEYGKLAWQFLIAVNGGGAIAILTLLGAVSTLRNCSWMYFSLSGYVFGLSLVGIAIAHQVIKFQYLLDEWVKNSNEFSNGNQTWEKLIIDDNSRVKKCSSIPWILGIGSLLIFLGTTVLSASMLWKSQFLL